MFKVNIQNVKVNVGKVEQEIIAAVKEELSEFGRDVVHDAMNMVPVDEGHLKNSISFSEDGLGIKISVNADYAAYLEFGTRGYAAKYVSTLPADWQKFASGFKGKGGGTIEELVLRIMDWVKRKGISGTYSVKTKKRTKASGVSQEFEDADVAYSIALSILRKGIKAQPYLYPSIERNKVELQKRLKAL